MKTDEIVDVAIAKVVPLTMPEQTVNVNRPFVLAMVNEAYHTVERAALWKFSEAEATLTVESGSRTATEGSLPADLGVPLLIVNTATGDELTYLDERQIAPRTAPKGVIHSYSHWDGELRFWPLANKDHTLYLKYYKTWPDLVDNANNEPLIPETWQDLLHEYAAGKLAHRLPPTGDRFLPNSRAQPYYDSFEMKLGQMLQSDLVLKTFDKVPVHAYYEEVLNPEYY